MATASISTRSIQGESLPAAIDRLINTVLLGAGVVGKAAGSFKVSQDTGSNMQIKVGSGTAGDIAVVESGEPQGGTYVCEHQNATQTLVVSAADPADDRIDIVVLRVYDDTFDSSGREEADLEIIEGTPAGSPTAPAVPAGAIKLAEIEVGAGVSAITDDDITDARTSARTRGPAARGHIAEARKTTSQTNISSEVVVSGVSIPANLEKGRRYRISLSYDVVGNGAGRNARLRIRDGGTGGTTFATSNYVVGTTIERVGPLEAYYEPAADESRTFVVTAECPSTGTIDLNLTSERPLILLLEDVGPALD